MLLPTQHPQIRVVDDGREVTATFEDRRWMFPSGDCRLLPVANTTAELLAAYIGEQLLAALGRRPAKHRRACGSKSTSATARSASGSGSSSSPQAVRDRVSARLGYLAANFADRQFFSSCRAARADTSSGRLRQLRRRSLPASTRSIAHPCPTFTTPPCC